MRPHRLIPALFVLLAATAPPALAEGRWCVSLGAGESVSQRHGSALDAAVFAELDPLVGLGVETGTAYMNDGPAFDRAIAWGPGRIVGGLTDGITRNRAYYLGPAAKLGRSVYAVASAGLYEFSDNAGGASSVRWGGSAGLGLSGPGRFEPRGELRYRWANDATHSASAFLITLGFHIR